MNYEVYCDESCLEALNNKTAHDYIGIGGIWVPAEYREILKENLKKIKERHGINGELKWNKLSPAFYNCYKEIIDYFFSTESIRSRVILIKSDIVDNYKFHQSDAELSFYKFYYQLLQHWILDFNKYSIFVDHKVNRDKSRLNLLKRILEHSNITSLIRNVQALPSEESLGIQLADIITGLVTAKFNSQNTSKAKLSLINYIEETHLKHSIAPTSKGVDKFNIFKINLRGGW